MYNEENEGGIDLKEDIEIIEEMIEEYCSCSVDEEGFDMRVDIAFMKKECKALENLLIRYKQLEEENKSKQKAYDDCYCEYKHYKQFDSIPKSKVKEKIEEYDKQRIKMEKDDIGVGFTLGKEWSDLKAKIESLQELLEKE